MTAYVDTHILIWIGLGEKDKLSSAARRTLSNNDVLVSAAVVLELELLHEIGKIKHTSDIIIAALESEIGLRVCNLPFREIVNYAVKEAWTRDPFDRLIVANAKAAGAPLVTKDERIRKHYRRAVW